MIDTHAVDNVETQDKETRQIQTVASYGFLLNLGLTVMKASLAFFIFFAGYEIARHAFSPAVMHPDISLATILFISAGTIATFIFGRYALASDIGYSPALKACQAGLQEASARSRSNHYDPVGSQVPPKFKVRTGRMR